MVQFIKLCIVFNICFTCLHNMNKHHSFQPLLNCGVSNGMSIRTTGDFLTLSKTALILFLSSEHKVKGQPAKFNVRALNTSVCCDQLDHSYCTYRYVFDADSP